MVSEVEKLTKKVDALTAQIATMEKNLTGCVGDRCSLIEKRLEEQKSDLAYTKAELAESKKAISGIGGFTSKDREELKKCVGDECAVIRGELQATSETLMSQIDERFIRKEQEEAARKAAIIKRMEQKRAAESAAQAIQPTPAPAPAPTQPPLRRERAPPAGPTAPAETPKSNEDEILCRTCEMPLSMEGIEVGQSFKCPHCGEILKRTE